MKITSSKAKLYVGIDVAKKLFDICAMHENGDVMKIFQIEPTQDGFNEFILQIPSGYNLIVGMEKTGPYSGNFLQLLKNIKLKVILAHPTNISIIRKVFSKSVKNDRLDASTIANALRMNILSDSQRDPKYVFLQDLLERYSDLIQRKNSLTNQLRASLIQTFPEIESSFSDISCNSAISILAVAQTANDLIKIKKTKIYSIIRKNNGRVQKKKLDTLFEKCNNSIAWKTTEFHKEKIKSYIRELRFLSKEVELSLNNLRKVVNEKHNKKFELLCSVPGISDISAMNFLAIIGNHERFDPNNDGKGAKRLSSYLGYDIKEYSSGNRAIKTGISKQGNSMIRGLLYMASLSAIRVDPDLKSKYENFKIKGNGKKALVSISHTLARRMYGVLKTGKMYNPQIPLLGIHTPLHF